MLLVWLLWWHADMQQTTDNIVLLLRLTESAPHNRRLLWRMADSAQTIDTDHISTLLECKHYKL